jgi:hypothetical protein
MKPTSILLIAPLVGLLAAGCGDDKKDPPVAPTATATAAMSAKPTATAAAASATATATAVAANDDDIPSEVDFEDEAEKDITVDNLEAELASLEKEVAAE